MFNVSFGIFATNSLIRLFACSHALYYLKTHSLFGLFTCSHVCYYFKKKTCFVYLLVHMSFTLSLFFSLFFFFFFFYRHFVQVICMSFTKKFLPTACLDSLLVRKSFSILLIYKQLVFMICYFTCPLPKNVTNSCLDYSLVYMFFIIFLTNSLPKLLAC